MNTEAAARLNALLPAAGLAALDAATAAQFETYLSLILRWNARLNLISIRDETMLCINHLAESIVCARTLPDEIRTLLDYGSGAGLPGIPIALCRREIAVTLAESQGRKAAFLREAVRVLEIKTKVYPARAESLTEQFDCVTLRAVDKMPKAVATAARLLAPKGWLALMTTTRELAGLQTAAGPGFTWNKALPMPFSKSRILALGRRINSQA